MELTFQILLLLLVSFIAYYVYRLFSLPNNIKHISYYSQLKEIKSNPIQSIFLFNLTNTSYQNIDRINFTLKFDSNAIINDCKLYNSNIVFTKVNSNELKLTIRNFNKWEKITFKIQATNCRNKYFNLISNSTGIKMILIGGNKNKLNLIRFFKLITYPYRKSIFPLLNRRTENREKRKKNSLKITTIVSIMFIINICFPGIFDLAKYYQKVFPKNETEQNINIDSLNIVSNRDIVQNSADTDILSVPDNTK